MKTPKHIALAASLGLVVGLGASACGGTTKESGPVASNLIMAGPPEFKTRADGLPGLKKNYNVVFGKYTPTDAGGPVTIQALKNGNVEAADLFTTNPAIAANHFVVLTDPKSNFAAQNVVPIVNKAKATAGVRQVLNGISAKLTTTGLTELVGDIQDKKQDPADVAKKWLSDQGLDAKGGAAKGATLTVGSANFPENVVLAEIYTQALQAQGATVRKKLNIGSREKYFPALKSGTLDVFPEYTGTILTYLDKSATATKPDDVYAALAKALPANLVALDKSPAQDSDAIVVTKQTADKYGLKSIADLAKNVK